MGRLASDACGPTKAGHKSGLAFVYQGNNWDDTRYHAWYQQVEITDNTSLELMATIEGLKFLTSITTEPHIIYTDNRSLFDYLAGVFKTQTKHESLVWELLRLTTKHPFAFEQVKRTKRDAYPLYMMADALSRAARAL